MVGRSCNTSNIVGIDGPYMSASIIPTEYPAFKSPPARFAVSVDLPTPPFPEAMAMIFFTSGKTFLRACLASAGIPFMVQFISTDSPKKRRRLNSIASCILFLA